MQKRWVVQSSKETEKVALLEQSLKIPTPLATILVGRSIQSFEAAKSFFRPSLDALHNPYLMQGMERAVVRLAQALANQEAIWIYGDYDVDGTTAVAMFYIFLKTFFHANINYYIPDRLTEGYGISIRAITQAQQADVSLIIALDCGIKDYISIAHAVALGIDVIICDHHEVAPILPPAYAILNPKQPGCSYPCKELSGCGIGFKLIQAFCQYKGLPPETISPFLDLVAISTACDIVPLVDENRILAYYGIKQLENHPRPGLQALMELVPHMPTITISDIVFKIGPRLNVAGRMSHASLAVQLLIEQEIAIARDLAQIIDQQNLLRRALDDATTQEALESITNDLSHQKKSNVLFNPHWHKGIIGIVAARCTEQHYKPTIVLTLSEGKASGSGRSIPGYNIYRAIASCSELLHQYGGHAYAVGLTMPLENMIPFQEKFEQTVAATIADHLLIPEQPIHAYISLEMITEKFVRILMQMAPFGTGNPAPVFVTEKVYIHDYKVLKGQHLKLTLYQPGCNSYYPAIGFGLASYAPLLTDALPLSIAYTIDYNYYLGHRSTQLIIKDIRK